MSNPSNNTDLTAGDKPGAQPENPTRSWLNFFCLKLPLAALTIGIIVEALAWSLSGVTLHRHNVDDLANAVEHDSHHYKVVLLGDSVTHNVANKYRIGAPNEVADLTTHALTGLPGSYFLLRRYLESGHRPQLVVLALSRHVLTEPMDHSSFDYYVTSVFRKPYERSFLQAHYRDYVDYSWRPAALSMTTKIGEPLFSLLRHPGDQIWVSPEPPSEHPILDHFPDYRQDPAIFKGIVTSSWEMRPEARALLEAFCQLSLDYHFKLRIIWAPMAPDLRAALVSSGAIPRLNNQVSSILRGAKLDATIYDSSDGQNYPYFDRGLLHIRGLGWEQTYANELTHYIHQFESDGGHPEAVGPTAAAMPGADAPTKRFSQMPAKSATPGG